MDVLIELVKFLIPVVIAVVFGKNKDGLFKRLKLDKKQGGALSFLFYMLMIYLSLSVLLGVFNPLMKTYLDPLALIFLIFYVLSYLVDGLNESEKTVYKYEVDGQAVASLFRFARYSVSIVGLYLISKVLVWATKDRAVGFWTAYVLQVSFILLVTWTAGQVLLVVKNRVRRHFASGEMADLLYVFAKYTVYLISFLVLVLVSLFAFGYGELVLNAAKNAVVSNLSNIVIIVVVFFLTWFLVRFFKIFFAELKLKAKGQPAVIDIASLAVKYLIYCVSSIIVLTTVLGALGLGNLSTSIVTIFTVFIGMIVSFSATGTVGNALAGLILMGWRPYSKGDRVEVGGVYGDVIEQDIVFTKIRTIKDQLVHVPNLSVMGDGIVNYSSRPYILNQRVSVGYDADRNTVEKLLLSAARKTKGLLGEPRPFVLLRDFKPYHISYEINAYTAQQNKLVEIRSDLLKNIYDSFAEAKVDLASPLLHYDWARRR